MHVHVPDLLVRQLAVVLQDVVVHGARGDGELLGDGEKLGEGVVGDVGEFLAVVFGDYELVGGGGLVLGLGVRGDKRVKEGVGREKTRTA